MSDHILRQLNEQSLATSSWSYPKRWIYLIQMTSNGADDSTLPIKIGIAQDVLQRLRSLEGNHPFPLRLVSYFPAIRGIETERAIHLLFDDFRIRPNAEWFIPDPTILVFFDEQHARFKEALTCSTTANGNRRRALAHLQEYEEHQANEYSMDAWERFSKQGMIVTRLRIVDEPVDALQPKYATPDQISRDTAIRDMYTERALRPWFDKRRIGVINTEDMSRLTGIEKSEIRNMAKDRKLPHIRLGRGIYAWRPQQVAESLRVLGLDLSQIDLFDNRL